MSDFMSVAANTVNYLRKLEGRQLMVRFQFPLTMVKTVQLDYWPFFKVSS